MSKVVVVNGYRRLDFTEERERAADTDWVPRLGPDTRDMRDPQEVGERLARMRKEYRKIAFHKIAIALPLAAGKSRTME